MTSGEGLLGEVTTREVQVSPRMHALHQLVAQVWKTRCIVLNSAFITIQSVRIHLGGTPCVQVLGSYA